MASPFGFRGRVIAPKNKKEERGREAKGHFSTVTMAALSGKSAAISLENREWIVKGGV